MTIKKRLIFSYLAMLLVPFVLIMLTSGLLNYFNPSGPFSNSRYSHFPLTQNGTFTYFNKIVINSPTLLFSESFMKNIETDLNLPGAVAVIQDGNIMYKSSWISSKAVLEAVASQNNSEYRFKKHMEPVVLFHWEFTIPEQHNGVLYYLIDPQQIFSQYFPIGIFFILGVAIILIITNGTLTIMVSRSIILPLKELEKAAVQIRDGNLNNPIECKANDEMGNVFSTFNEMRERLKGSLDKQISYEENRKELIASISHDLRTPLTILKGYVEGLKDGVPTTEEKKNHYLDTIYQKAHQMDHLIDDLFLFSRLEMDKFPFKPVSLELSQWLLNAVSDLSVDYPEIIFETSINEKAFISADPGELFRVISNIVQNSHIYAGSKSVTVTVEMEFIDNQVQIIVSDNGTGIPYQQLPFIFEHFYQIDESRNRNSKGTGLGLSIASMIIEQHHGSIKAESPPGKGLSVIIQLPLLPETNNPAARGDIL